MPDCGANSKAARRVSHAAIIVTLCLGALVSEADAQLYKWVDEKGRTQYSDKPQAGQKSQEMKIQGAPASPVQAPPSAAKADLPGNATDGTGPRAGVKTAAPNDAKRLHGGWATEPGARVDVKFAVTFRDGSEVLVGQQWSLGGRAQVDTPSKYAVTGSGGNGTMDAQNALSPQAPDVPAQMGYRLDGDTLILSVSSGLFAGEHSLKRK
jgi:Domain of unknown function (DUF4124)